MNDTLPRAITEDEIAAYRNDGVALLKGLFDADWVEHLREAVAQDMANPSAMWKDVNRGGTGNFFGDTFVWVHVPGFRRFLRESPVAEVAATVRGEAMRKDSATAIARRTPIVRLQPSLDFQCTETCHPGPLPR